VRLAAELDHEEFAQDLTAHLGWQVPAGVLRAWERGECTPPRQVQEAVRNLAAMKRAPRNGSPPADDAASQR
jgi:hypothetical protein